MAPRPDFSPRLGALGRLAALETAQFFFTESEVVSHLVQQRGTRKRGKSGSKRPSIKTVPRWVRYKKGEIEEIVVKLSKEGNSTSKVGLILRDQFGIPSVKLLTGKTISQIMKSEKLYPKIPEDLFNLLKQSVNLRNHLGKNKTDYTSKRGLELLESKIRRLGKYYVRRKVLPIDWKYDPEKVKLLVQQK